MVRCRMLILNTLLVLALLGSQWGRRNEGAEIVQTNFLGSLVLPFRDWKTSDVALTPSEESLLAPDSTLIRRYQASDGQSMELAIIAGHRKKTIHTPAVCMAGGGWETVTQQAYSLSLPDRKIASMRMLTIKNQEQLLVTYFFTDGEYCTSDLILFEVNQMFKRFGAAVDLGALVRITVPVGKNQAEAEHLTSDFARATLPEVLTVLRRARLREP